MPLLTSWMRTIFHNITRYFPRHFDTLLLYTMLHLSMGTCGLRVYLNGYILKSTLQTLLKKNVKLKVSQETLLKLNFKFYKRI
ncbi:hypothetical protein BDV34DRAFT_122851 [Aspergillus parasiticus]|uniref:Uncharacterized protein n=1 Tax=Aspergillus parasiticus TaxID=5067 RepID=A0A5N6DFT8_ASPPA|nr:hypothetical protein BDV34DRAFT_122851 [Aspergillus parasiticus]